MPFQFSDPAAYRFKDGAIFLGTDQQGREIGVQTERHAIAIAGSRTGKGAAVLIPNLLRWKSGAICIDPKGENTEKTWQARQAMGQHVVALDPFAAADIPASLRGGFNPLAALSATSPRIREKLLVLADGMVVSHDPRHMEWVEGTRAMLAGIIAFNVTTAPDEFRNLSAVRKVLLLPDEDLNIEAHEMMGCDECGGLVKAAGQMIVTALQASKGIEKDCLQKARAVTRWLDSPEIAACLSSSTFDMAALRSGKLTLFLILNPDDIEHYSIFFRLFVRSALAEMMAGGSGKNARVLFLLDEFFSLGKLDTIAKSAGLMPSYGVHLFPFLQDLGQLHELYGHQGAETFFDNADAHIFFGNSGKLTLEHISARIGKLTPNEVVSSPPPVTAHETRPFNAWKDSSIFESEATSRERHAVNQRNEVEKARAARDGQQDQYMHAMRQAGSPRLTASEVAALVGKSHGDKVARSMIVFAKAGDILNLRLSPYFTSSVGRYMTTLTPPLKAPRPASEALHPIPPATFLGVPRDELPSNPREAVLNLVTNLIGRRPACADWGGKEWAGVIFAGVLMFTVVIPITAAVSPLLSIPALFLFPVLDKMGQRIFGG